MHWKLKLISILLVFKYYQHSIVLSDCTRIRSNLVNKKQAMTFPMDVWEQRSDFYHVSRIKKHDPIRKLLTDMILYYDEGLSNAENHYRRLTTSMGVLEIVLYWWFSFLKTEII